MKKLIFLGCLFIFSTIKAQNNQKAISIDVNMEMFVQLVFKSPIQHFKVGLSNLVEVQSNDNTLTVQALTEELKTNVIVKTTDGLYYSFVLNGTKDLPTLFFQIDRSQALNFGGTNRKEKNDDENKSIDEKVLEQKGYINSRNVAEFKKIALFIKGIYVNNNRLYFLLEIENKSNIKYDIEKLAFFTSAKKKSKRQVTAEEQEFEPHYFFKELANIAPKSKIKFVAVFDKFTLNNDKEMEITLSEKQGERIVRLLINTEHITDAQTI